MKMSEARLVDRQKVQELDPGTLVNVIRIIILVIEFCREYKDELGAVGRLVLKMTGLDKRIEALEHEAKSAIAEL